MNQGERVNLAVRQATDQSDHVYQSLLSRQSSER